MVAPRPSLSPTRRIARVALLIAIVGIVAIVGSLSWFGRRIVESERQLKENLRKADKAQAAVTGAETRKSELEKTNRALEARTAELQAGIALLSEATDQSQLKSAAVANPTLAKQVPIVYIQVHRDDPEAMALAKRVQASLSASGFLVPAVDAVPLAFGRTLLKRNVAESGSANEGRLLGLLDGLGVKVQPASNGYRGKPNQWELWLASP